MLIELDRFTLPSSTTLRGGGATIDAKNAAIVWDTTRGVVWVKPNQFGQATRVYAIGHGSELIPKDGAAAFEALMERAAEPRKQRPRKVTEEAAE